MLVPGDIADETEGFVPGAAGTEDGAGMGSVVVEGIGACPSEADFFSDSAVAVILRAGVDSAAGDMVCSKGASVTAGAGIVVAGAADSATSDLVDVSVA